MRKRKAQLFRFRFLQAPYKRLGDFVLPRRSPRFSTLPKFLSLRQTASILHVHPNTLRGWDASGKLRAVRFGARHDRRYLRDEVAAIWTIQQAQRPARRFTGPVLTTRRLGVSLALVVLTLSVTTNWSRLSAFATGGTTVTVNAVPVSCVGWKSAGQATTRSLDVGSPVETYTEKNSAIIRTADFGLTDAGGRVTTSFDRVEPALTCSGFTLSGTAIGELQSARFRLAIATGAEVNSTDAVHISSSYDGQHWTRLLTLPARRDEQGEITIAVAGLQSADQLKDLRLRFEPDFSVEHQSIAAVDGVTLELVGTKPAAATTASSDAGRKKELDRLTAFSQDSYEISDQPAVLVPKKQTKPRYVFGKKTEDWSLKKVELIDAEDKTIEAKYRTTDETKGDDVSSRVSLRMENQHPGKYRVRVTMVSPAGTTETIEEPFLWGVVALNYERASPQPGETERVGMAILDDEGRTICDAEITVKVRDPRGRTTTYQTKKKTITTNTKCVDKGITNEADYLFTFTPELKGAYHVSLKATTDAGQRNLEDNLFVTENQVFDIQRIDYPTRINPYAGYPVRIAVTPRRDYAGLVYERVPDTFKIYDLQQGAKIEDDPSYPGMKRIAWEVDWQRRNTYYLTYKFVAPPISPALFLTGPLTIRGNNLLDAELTEPRQWQIASDSISSVSWDGSASALWSDPANWSTNEIPKAGDYLVFPAGAANYSNTNDLGQNMWFNSITFYDSGYTLAGDRIILGQGRNTASIILPGIADEVSSGGNTISLDLQFDATQLISVTNSGEALTISGAISGVGGLSKEGLGELIFSGANSYAGVTKVNVGSLNIRHARGLGTILSGTEVVGEAALEIEGSLAIDREALTLRGYGQSSSGALRNISGTSSFDGPITIAGTTEIASDSGTLTLNGGLSGTFNLNLDGAGDITFAKASLGAAAATTVTKNGSGTVTYNFPNTYTGLTTINAGTLAFGCDNATMTGGITVNGGTLDIGTYSDMQGTITLGTLAGGSGTISGSTGMLSSATWTVYAGTISAKIGGDGGTLTKSTPGTVTLSGANEFTGATTVSAGILKLQNSAALGTVDGITTLTSGASIQVDGNGLSIPEFMTIAGVGLLNQGAIFNTTGDNEVTGLVTLSAAASIETATGTTLTFSDKGFTGAFGVTFDATGDIAVSAPIQTSSGALIKDGPGNLTLTNYNSYTGTTTVNFGTLTLSGNGSITTSSGVTTNSGSKLVMDNSSNAIDRVGDAVSVTMNGGDIDFYGSSSTDTLGILGALTMSGGQNTITVFAGTGGYTILRFASLTRTAGATGLFRGASLGATPAANVATIRFTTAPTLLGDDDAAGTPKVSIIQGIFGDNSTSGTGTDMVTYGRGNNYGVRLLNGAGFSNEYTSDYLVTNANVKLTTATAAVTTQINSLILDTGASITNPGSSQTMTFTSGNILNLQPSGSIAGANTTLAAGSTEFILRTPQDLTVSSLITTTGGLSKSGTGTLTFSTAKTYTGLTAVNAGTLLYGIDDAISSGNVTVHDATLDMATYNDTVGAVVAQGGTITGTSGVLTATSYSFRASTISAIIGGSGTTTIANTNERVDAVTTLSRDNTYTGTTSIASGVLKLGGTGGGSNTPLGTTAGATSITNGAMLDLNGYTLVTAEAINTFRGTGIAGQGAIINSSVTPVTYSGNLTIATSARIGADYGKITVSGSISGTGLPLTVGGFGDIDITGAILTGASGSVTKDGFGTYTPSSASSDYTGVTTISVGRLKLGGTGSGSTTPLGTVSGATSITNAAGASFDLNGYTLVTAEPLTVNGVGAGTGDFASGAVLNSGSAVTYSGPVTLGASSMICGSSGSINFSNATMAGTGFTITLCGSGGGTIGSTFTGGTNGAIVKIDSGTWTLSGSNTYTGATTIYQGTIQLGATGGATNTPLGTTGAGTTVYSGGVLDLNGFTLGTLEAFTLNGFGIANGGCVVNSSGNPNFSGNRTLSSDIRVTNTSGSALIWSGTSTGTFETRVGGSGDHTLQGVWGAAASTVWKDGAGIATVTAAQGWTGNTTVIAGTFRDGVLNGLSSGNVVVAGGTFDLSVNNTDTVGGVYLIDGTIATSGGGSAILTTTGNTIESGTISGVMAGAVTTTKNTAGTVSITGGVTASGALTINAGSVTLSGANGAIASITAATINLGGKLAVDNTSANNTARLSDSLVVTMNGGEFSYTGSSSTNSSETISQLAYATGHNVVTVAPGTGGSTTLTVGNATCFNRSAGATVLYRGVSLGSTPAANVSTLVCTNAPTVFGGGGASGSTTISILRGSFGDNSTTGTGTDMVTHNVGNTNGLRLLNGPGFSGEYVTNGFGTNNANVKITSNTAAATQNVNSIVINGGDITNPGTTQTITTSGAALAGNVLIASANNFAGSNTVVALTAATELSTLATANTTISALIGNSTTGIGVFSGSGNVTLSAAQTYTGTTYINNGHSVTTSATVTEGTAGALSTGGVTVVGGTFDANGNTESIGAITLTGGTVKSGAATLTTTGTLTTIANANVSSKVTGTVALPTAAVMNIGDGLVDHDAVISAVLTSASTSLTKSTGTGVLVLSGDSTYTGTTSISTGTIRLGAAGGSTNTPLGTSGGSTSISSGAALDFNGYSLTSTEPISTNGTGISNTGALLNTSSTAVTYPGLLTLVGATAIYANYGDINITNTGTVGNATVNLELRGNGNGSFASILGTTTGTLTKSGTGTWTVSGASTYTGVTTISVGVLKLGSGGSGSNTPLGTTSTGTTIASGAMLDLNGYTLTTAENLTNVAGTGIANAGFLVTNSASATSYSGTIALTAAARISNFGTGTFTLSGANSGNFALTMVAAPGTIDLSGVRSGTSTITKEGSGVLILSGQNSFTGAITVSTGILRVGANGGGTNTPLGTIAGGVTVSLGAVLDLSTFTVGGASTWEPLTSISGTGLKNGGAVISSASGNNNFGATTVTANSRIVNSGSGTITLVGNVSIANTINLGIGGTGPTTISGGFPITTATSATLAKWDSGLLIMSNAGNVYTGLTRIYGGTLRYGAANAVNTGGVTLAGGTLDFNGQTDSVGAIILYSGTITDSNVTPGALTGSSYTFYGGAISGVLGGTGVAMPKNSGSTLTINKSLTNTGTLTANAGTVQYLVSNVLSNSSALTVAGGTIDMGTNSDTVAAVTLTSGNILSSTGVLTGSSYAVATGKISAILAGAVNLTKSSTGTVVLAGTNTYTGITTIQGGALSVETIGNGTVPGNLGAATNAAANIVFSTGTGTLIYTGGTASTDRNITTTAAITMQIDVNDPTTTLTMSGATTNTTAPFTKVGVGTLVLSGTNLHTGVTSVLSGTLKYGAANILSTGGLTVTNGILDMNGQSDSVGTVTLTNGGQIIDSAGSSSVLTSTATLSIQSGFISVKLGGSVTTAFTKSTTDRVVLSGDNTFTSTAGTVSAGHLTISHNNALGASGTTMATTVSPGAVLEIKNSITTPSTKTLTILGTGINASGALLNASGNNTVQGAITLGATGVRINSDSGQLTCSGTMTGTGFTITFGGAGNIVYSGAVNTSTAATVTKDGTGTTTLSNANNYTGATTISAGVLAISNATSTGTTAGGVTVADGAALEISGTTTVGAEALTLNGTGISSGGALRSTSGATAWQGAVTLASNSSIGVDANTLTVSGTITGSGSIGLTKVGAGTLSTATTNVGGSLTISAGTLTAAGNYTVGGNWTNSGTFNHGSQTVTLNGTAQQNVSGTTSGATGKFNALTITNAFGDGSTTWSVTFAGDTETAATFTAITASTKLRFNAGSTYTFQNISLNGQASGTKVFLRSSSSGSAWNLAVAGTRSVSNTDVKDSDATTSGTAIDATDGTNTDSTGNTNWSFVLGITVSGGCFTDATEGTPCTDDGSDQIKVAWNGTLNSGVDAVVDGAWSFTLSGSPANGDILVFFRDGEATASEEATTVVKYDGSGNVTNVKMYQSQLVIGTDSGSANSDQTITVANLDTTTNGYENSDDEDVIYDITAGSDLTVDAEADKTERLYIMNGETFQPASGGGSDTTTHHLEIDATATMTADSNAINVAGDFLNAGTFTAGTSTLTMNGTGTLTSNGNTINNFVTSGGGTVTLANATHTFAGDVTLGSTGLTAGSSTVVMTGTKNLVGGGKTLNNLTIDGTNITVSAITSDLTIDGVLTIGGVSDGNNDTLSIDSGRTVRLSANSGTNLVFNDTSGGTNTISGSGILLYENSTTTFPASTGVVSSGVRFGTNNNIMTIPARTFGGDVSCWEVGGFSCVLGTAGGQTITISGNLLLEDHGTTIALNGSTNNPTVNLTGNFSVTNASSTTLSMGSGTWTVGGNFDLSNLSTLNHNSGTLVMSGTSKSLTSNGKTLNAFSPSGTISNVGNLTLAGSYNQTAGTFTHAANTTMTVTGTSFTIANGATWTKTSGTGKLVLDNVTNLAFADNNTTKQNLGVVQVGASPGTVTLTTDMSADTVTIPTGDTFNTKGYDVTSTGAFACNGTCVLDMTDSGGSNEGDGTILDVGGDFTMSTTGTLTAATGKVFLNATSGNKTFSSGGKTYNDVELKNTDGTNDDITIADSPFDVNGVLTLTDGQVRLDTNDPNVTTAGNISIASAATVTKADNGTSTWTFDGSGTNTWTDGTGSGGQDLGVVHINGTTKTVNLASSAKATKLIIAASQTFGLGSSAYVFTLTGSGLIPDQPLQNSGTLNEGSSSTVKFTGTSDSDIDPESFNNLNVSPSGAGSPVFNVDINETGNPLDVTGTVVLGDGTNDVTLNVISFCVMTVGSDFTINAGGTFGASSDGGLYIGGSYLNNGSFVDSGAGVTFNATTTGKTIAGNITGANKIIALFFDGSGGEWTNSSALETSYLSLSAGTFAGTNDVTVLGPAVGTAGVINRTGGTFTLNPSSSASFGPSTASTAWVFNNLTFTTSAGSQVTNSVTTCATCTMTINGAMSVDTKVTLNIASSLWTVVGSLTTTTSGAIGYTGTPTVTVQGSAIGGGSGNIIFYNLTKSGAGTTTWSGTGYNVVRNTLTLSAGTLVAPSNTLYVKTYTESGGTFTHNSGTVMFNTDANQTLTAATTFNNATFNDGLVGYWNLDETAGTSAADSSGYGHTGSHTNTPTISSDVPTVNFTNPRSLDFNGTSQYVDLGTAPFINTEFTDKITLSAWIKPNSLTGDHVIVGKSYADTHGSPFYEWNLFQSGSIICFRVGTSTPCSGGGTLTTGWQLITGVYDGANMYLYRNGTQVATTSKTGNVGNGPQSARIAGRDTPTSGLSEYFAGKIDDVRIYRRALSSGEVTTLSNGNEWGLSGATWTLGADLTVAGNLGIKTGTLDTHVTNNRSITVGSSWLNDGGVFTARAGTVTMNAGSSGKTITAGQQSFYLLNLNNASGGWTMSEVYTTPTITVSNNMVITAGTLTALAGTLSVGGDFNNAGTFTHNSGTVTMTGSSKNITGGSATTFNNLTISGTTGIDAAGSDATVASLLTVDNTKTLTINTGRIVTLSGTSGTTLSLVGTITGAGRLTYKNNATAFPSTGTISSILRMDATAGDQSIGGTNSATRTFGGLVEIYSNSAGTAKTVTLENGTARTFAFSGNLHVIADNTQNLTLTADTATDPTVTVAGDLDFTGTGGGTEIITSGTGTWTVSGNSNFTGGTYTATSGNKLVMNGTSKTLTSASQSLYDYEVSGGTVAIADATTVTRDLILSGGTLTGPSALTLSVGRNWTKTSGSYTANSGTVALTTSTSATISGSTTFFNLSVTGIGAAKTVLTTAATTQTITGTWTVTGASGQLVTINAATAAQWNVNPTSASLDYVDISYTNNQGTAICATHSQSTSGNNTGITVSAGASCGITISGVIRQSSDETSAYDCSANTLTIGAVVNGGASATADCTLNTGFYSINAANAPSAAGDPVVVYINNGETPIGTTVTLAVDTSSNITNLDIIDGRLVTTYENAGPMTNAKMATGDNGNAGIRYAVSSGNLTVESGVELHVKSGKTFTPGGTVTTTATGTAAGSAGDLHIAGTLTMGTNALTVGGDYNNAGTFNKTNTQTTTLAATGTGFTITPGTGDMNNLTVSGDAGGNGTYTLSGANVTVDGVLTVNTGDTLSIDTSRTLTNSGSTEASIGGTVSGAGTLRFVNGSGGPGTGGTLSAITRFDASSGDVAASTVDARTYSGKVELYASSSSDRTITLPSSTITLSGGSSHLHMKADGAGDLTVDGAANNPTVTVGGDIALNGTGDGVEAWVAGDNTWTSSGNVDTAQGFYAPHMAVLNPTWDNYGYQRDEYTNDGFGGCDFAGTTYSCGTSSSTTTNQGVTTGASSACTPVSASDYNYRTFWKFNLSGVSNTNTVLRADLQLYATSAGGSFSIYRAGNDAPDVEACNDLFAVGTGTALNNAYSYASGTNLISLGGTGDIQSSLGNSAYAVVADGGTPDSVLSSVDSSTNKPKLRIGYYTSATSPTLVMNGTGTLSSGVSSGYYNLTMSGTNTFNATQQAVIYNTLDLTGGTITANSAPVVMAGTASTVIGGNNTLGNLTVSGGTTTLTTSDLTTSLNVQLLSGGTLSIASGRTLTAQGNVLLNSGTTISGAGTLTMTSTSSGPGSAGTLSSLVRYDATGGNIANTTLDARTYGGAVEFYSNSGSTRTATAPSSGTFTFSSSVTTTSVGGSTLTLDLDDTTDPTVTIAGATTLGANTTLQAPSGTTLTLNGNYTNNGTFTDNSGTVALSGSAQQTLSGTMTGSSDFNNLTVTNASGSNPESSPSVIFGAAASAAGTFTATTADTKLRFAASATYTFLNVTMNGQAVGTRVYLRSSSTGTQWNLVSTGTQTVSNTDVRDSYACGGDTIDAIDGTSQDSTHNDCWNINTISMSISDTTIGFGACTSGSARYATGDTNGASSDSADAHTISVATNARGGYSLTVAGSTLTSSAGTITALGGSATSSSPGSEQFGLRAIKNSGTGTVSSPFDTANWAFTPSTTQTVASYTGSSSSYSAAYGLRYLCNVAGVTEAGSYSTDLTYILTSTF